ncbi:hypothetical protein [Aquisphaera insulae]|uniref:hypothetical protein n=1 Tax=Aquisphaera insulae TaxID=2712864 RepID=UPI0013ECD95B|nr:hypothetical protein [Aquisphaera insulae]
MPRISLAACCLALLSAGCGGGANSTLPPEAAVQDSLTQIAELCRNYQFTKQKPPQKLSDFNTSRTMGANGFQALEKGDVILLYNAKLPDLDEDPGHADTAEILAYEKSVPTSGGQVLLLNRTIRSMTPEEFKAAPRPAGAHEATPEPAAKKK